MRAAIRFSSVAGVRNGVVIEAPITTQHRHVSFQLIDLLAKVDLIYAAGVEAAPLYKKLVKQILFIQRRTVGFYYQNIFERIPKRMNLPVKPF